MKRIRISLEDIAGFDNLALAAYKAGKQKRQRKEVREFFNDFDHNINCLRDHILTFSVPCSGPRVFTIFDPKKRQITAPGFKDRVIHHAIMNHAGPILDRAMTDYSFACRPGKGVHAAAQKVRQNIQRFKWYVKIDIKSYFDSINHELLLKKLAGKFKGNDFFHILKKIIRGYSPVPGKGLPIGTLTSQYFANYYLDSLDRLITALAGVRACVRYMDDIVWWCDEKPAIKDSFAAVRHELEHGLLLNIKEKSVQINKSRYGISYCGFRIFPGTVKISQRKKKRYALLSRKWEKLYLDGRINENQLSRCYDAVHSITAQANTLEWRKKYWAQRSDNIG